MNIQEKVAQLNATAVMPESSDFRDGANAAGFWYESRNGRVIVVEQVVGGSGVYLVETDQKSGEILRDDRPWQMRV